MANLMIRSLQERDLSWVVEQETRLFGSSLGETHYQTLLQLGSLFGYVAQATDRQGALLCSHNGEHAQIENLFVLMNARRQGVATQLLQTLMADCETRNIRYISLEVREDHLVAIRLYESLEFQVIKRIPNYYSDHTDALFMVHERSER
jgi:ribosomal protein S18 acetylase RimI-like enzyme